ncbi:MAG: GTP cyclohydrolase MptA [Promethearchaeota archaeon]
MPFKRDLQNEDAEFAPIPIDKVGITNVLKKIEIVRGNFKLFINGNISAYIYLPATQRGIHMSRSAESIEDVINHEAFKPVKTVEEFCGRIAVKLLNEHNYTNHAEVEMKGTLILNLKANERDQIQQSYEICSNVKANRLENGKIAKVVRVGVWVEGMTACPCAQEMSREFATELLTARKDLGINPEKIDEILNIIPLATHNQRAKAQVIVGNSNGEQQMLDVLELIKVIESSMSATVTPVLKRPDEATLVRMAHLNPKFAEDVVRDIAAKLASEKFKTIPGSCTVTIKIISFESIHHHDVYCELNSTFSDLREKIKLTK